MTLVAAQPQKVQCDKCGAEKRSDSGHAPKGWHVVTDSGDYRKDFCCWSHMLDFFVAIGKNGRKPVSDSEVTDEGVT